MIVADTNLIAYLLLGGKSTPLARAVFQRDPSWAAPILWRSEFRSILAGYIRRGELSVKNAIVAQRKAEQLLAGREHIVASAQILQLVKSSTCSAYDCEFVALAERLRVPLVTSHKRILRDFPEVAIAPASFLKGSV
jgi:predicted nucleic acid-binding protein